MKKHFFSTWHWKVAAVFVLASTISLWMFSGNRTMPSYQGSRLIDEVHKYSLTSDETDIWSGNVRAYRNPNTNAMTGIVIEGVIREGYFKRFVQVAKEAGPEYSTVFLFSPGGDALEAMKIGSLIRMLRYNTEVWALDVEGERKCYFDNVSPQDCTCESACFLIFVGGVKRFSNMLGIHRVYLSHEALKTVKSSEALEVSKNIKSQVSQYLVEMGTPAELIEKMFTIPSNKMEYLSRHELDQLAGEIQDIEEWVSAKCPPMTLEEARASLESEGFDMTRFDGAKDKFIIEIAEVDCRGDVMDGLTVEGWRRVFKSEP